jgi:predicted kinase
MRKWMSERLKRRKKPGEGTAKEAGNAPEPLQPKFYDDQPAPPREASAEAPAPAPVQASARSAGRSVVRENAREDVNGNVDVEASAPRRSSRSQGSSRSQAPRVTSPEPVEPVAAPVVESAEGGARPRPARRRRSRGGRGGSRSRSGAVVAPVASAEAAVSAPASAGRAPVLATPIQSDRVQAIGSPARASKGTVVLAIGLPGSGKSSWFKRHSIHPLSSDLLRELLFDDAQEQRFQDLVFSNLRSMLKARLIARRPMNYVDATNLTPQDRHSWIKLAKDYGYDVQGVFFDVPLEVCMERHQRRGRAVPEDIMRKMAGKLKAPTFEEGFSKITVVRVKQKEAGNAVEAEAEAEA